jgi:hypothetical protein
VTADHDPAPSAGAAPAPRSEERLERAYADGRAAAERDDEAAPGCTTTPEGRAYLRGFVDGRQARARPIQG